MTKEILLILACVPLYVLNSFCDKWVSGASTHKYNCLYNCIKFFFCSLCVLPLLLVERSPVLGIGGLICGVVCGIMYSISKTVILKGYSQTSVAFMTLCHTSGMILPCIAGYLFWNEELGLLAIIGIVFTIVSIVLIKGQSQDKKMVDMKGFLFGLIIFLTSAGVMLTQKIMGIYFPEQSVGWYTLWAFFSPMLILSGFTPVKTWKTCKQKDKRILVFCALGSAVSLAVISMVMTTLAGNVPSVILFPLFNGVGIILVCMLSAVVFREKITLRKAVGLVLGLISLFLINL